MIIACVVPVEVQWFLIDMLINLSISGIEEVH